MYDLREKVRVDTRLTGLGELTMSVWNPPSWTGNGQVFLIQMQPALWTPLSDRNQTPVMSLFTLQALRMIAIDASNATVCCRVLQTDFPVLGKLSLQMEFHFLILTKRFSCKACQRIACAKHPMRLLLRVCTK